MSTELQVLTPGRGIEADGQLTGGTIARAVLTARLLSAEPGITSVDFSGHHSFMAPIPANGATEGRGMLEVAEQVGLPTRSVDGRLIAVHVDDSIRNTDTVWNFISGVKGGHLRPKLDTLVVGHADHYPRVEWLGGLVVPKMKLHPVLVDGGYTRASWLQEQVLLKMFQHVMRNVAPGDLAAIKAADAEIQKTFRQLKGVKGEVPAREKFQAAWSLLRYKG
jgi:hypothetical protein